MQTTVRGVAYAAAAVLAIFGSTEGSARAHAEGPDCAPDVTVQCAEQAQALQPDPRAGMHLTISCSPAMIGAHCTKRWVP